jgi:hypothetical protein
VVECLPSKCEALSLNSSTTKQKKEGRKRGREGKKEERREGGRERN